MHPQLDVWLLDELDRQRARARAGAHAYVAHACPSELGHERTDHGVQRLSSRGHGCSPSPSAPNIGFSFQSDSAYSAAALDSATMPHPANNVAEEPWTRADLMPTTNSPSPSRLTQPIGPAYQPRSRPSVARINSSAGWRGKPPIAGVGCSRSTRSSTPWPGVTWPRRGVSRCCRLGSFCTRGWASAMIREHTWARASR